MASNDSRARLDTLKRTFSSVNYATLVLLAVFFNLFLMVISFFILSPSPLDLQRFIWFEVSTLILIPVLGSFSICFFASIKTLRRITVSPVYVVLLTLVPALVLGAYVEYTVYVSVPETARMNAVFNYMFSTMILYLLWTYLAGVVLHPVIRSLIGAYAERDNIQSGTSFYKTSIPIGHMLNTMEDKKWLSELCSLRIVEKKEEENIVRLKLNKYKTNFYLAVFVRKVDSEILVSLTPYQLKENLAEKTIHVSNDSKQYLKAQTVEMEKSLKLEPISAEKSEILYDAINYAMSPARFPIILKYRNEFLVVAVALFFSMLATLSYFAGMIEIQTLVGIIAIIVAIGSTAITLLSKKQT